MLKTFLIGAAAALALTAGSAFFAPSQANAEGGVRVGGDWGYIEIGGNRGYGAYSHGGRGYAPYGYGSAAYGYDTYRPHKPARHSYRRAYNQPHCTTRYRKKRIRYWDEYNGCWEYKVVRRPYQVCH